MITCLSFLLFMPNMAAAGDKPSLEEVISIHRAIHMGLGDKPLPPFEREDAKPTVRTDTDGPYPLTSYSFGFCTVYVDHARSRVSGIGLGDPLDTKNERLSRGPIPRKITDKQAIELANRYYRVAGYVDPIDVFDISYDQNLDEGGLFLRFARTCGGVPYEPGLAGIMRFDPENGRLTSFYAEARDLPPVPAKLTAGVSAEHAANATAARILGDWDAVLVPTETRSSLLCIAATSGARTESSWARDDRSAAEVGEDERRRSRLIYLVTLKDPSCVPDVHGIERQYYARVDAATGKVLFLTRYPEAWYGGGGGGVAASAAQWQPAAAGFWSLVSGQGDVKPIGRARLLPAKAVGAPRGKMVTLKCERVFLRARFDRQASVLWIHRGAGKPLPFRPSGALLKALSK